MIARRVTAGWVLVLCSIVLCGSLFVAAERLFAHRGQEASPQPRAYEDVRAPTSDTCLETAPDDRRAHHAGEAAWPTQC